MSEAVSALSGASFEGIATVQEAGLCGMITLRGDLASQEMAAAVAAATGASVPSQRQISEGKTGKAAWMSPDELLLVTAYGNVDQAVEKATKALSGTHALVANVSDARAVFHLSGTNSRDVLAKLAPVDLSRDVFAPGEIRRTRLAQVPAAFWLNADDSFDIVCFRSVGQYVFDLLKVSSQMGGEVAHLG